MTRKPARHEVWIPGPDRRIGDVEAPGRFKAEAPVVARVSENEGQ